MSIDVISIGECMMELSRQKQGTGFDLAFGGDTFNTCVYLARSGVRTAYATALGNDPYSDAIRALAAAENIATDYMFIRPDRPPGLYMIETDAQGERSFHYWRDNAPVRELFDDPPVTLVDAMKGARLVYLSGITLWVLREKGRDNLFSVLDKARSGGTKIAFDGNFRPRLWNDRTQAKAVFDAMLHRTDIALPTYDDEQALWGDASPQETLARLNACGIREIVVKLGARGALCQDTQGTREIAIPSRVQPVDTTAAGDSFNAGYLAARLFGSSAADATRAGHILAGSVITHKGAIVPAHVTRGKTPVRPRDAAAAPKAQVP